MNNSMNFSLNKMKYKKNEIRLLEVLFNLSKLKGK